MCFLEQLSGKLVDRRLLRAWILRIEICIPALSPHVYLPIALLVYPCPKHIFRDEFPHRTCFFQDRSLWVVGISTRGLHVCLSTFLGLLSMRLTHVRRTNEFLCIPDGLMEWFSSFIFTVSAESFALLWHPTYTRPQVCLRISTCLTFVLSMTSISSEK